MADGTYMYPVKGGVPTLPSRPPVLIVCGNKHPAEIYTKSWPFIEARFNVQEVFPQTQENGHELPLGEERS
jgi:hypothetical protein